MKVIVEIPNKFVEIAKGVILGGVDNEEDEQKVSEIAEKVKTAEDPILLNLTELYDKEKSAEAAQMSQMNIALASFAMWALMKEAKL